MPTDSLTREVFGNIDPVSKWLFYALAIASLALFCYGMSRRARLWKLGRRRKTPVQLRAALKRFVRHVVFQSAVRRDRHRAGVAHALVFWGFAGLLLGTMLIALEHFAAAALGREADDPLFHKGVYFAVYETILDGCGLALLAGCAWFALRRGRGESSIGHNRLDWAVLGALMVLGITGYLIEGLRIIHEQTPQPGFSFVGLGVAKTFEQLGITRASATGLHFGLWWLHAILALGLIAVLPDTRLLHAIAGLFCLVTDDEQQGTLVPISIEEVEETGRVGVGRLQDFTRRQLLQLDACVSCGRCQDVCPAYSAGTPLSPRNVVQDVRSHLNDVGRLLLARDKLAADGNAEGPPAELPALHGDTISAETLWACTTCSACVDVCPLGVRPLEFITDMRRHLIGVGQLRGSPAEALRKLQRSGNPWGLSRQERFDWAEGLDVPSVKQNPDFDVLYWVGCAASYDRRIQKVARAVIKLLGAAHVNFAVLGTEERCTGEAARRMGDEFLFQELAQTNIAALSANRVSRIITHCPHCLNSLKQDYPQFGGEYEVLHHSQFLADLVRRGDLPIRSGTGDEKLTYHDPCYLARVNGVTEPPRELIELTMPAGGNKIHEMPRHGRQTSCCGAGGGRMWFDDTPDRRVGIDRVTEALETGADTIAVACPFCLTMLSDGVAAQNSNVQVKDVAELLAERLEEESRVES